jgi:uncharacterized membrane-anchored protein
VRLDFPHTIFFGRGVAKMAFHKSARENIVFFMISIAINLAIPTIAPAQTGNYNPINFTQPLNVSRGKIMPVSTGSQRLANEDACRLVTEKWGWSNSACGEIDGFILKHLPGIDTLLVKKPNSDGYVKFDDWGSNEAKDEISEIWDELVTGSKAQSQRAGEEITPLKWVVYPSLDKAKSYMYYAYLMRWGNEQVVNIKVSQFDRKGYVEFTVVPDREDYTSAQITQMIDRMLGSYQPAVNESYFDTQAGDKIAAAGAVGVLASLLGVKYGKTAAVGFFALAAIVLKKAWFLLLLPFYFLKNLFSKNANPSPTSNQQTISTPPSANGREANQAVQQTEFHYCEACWTPSPKAAAFCQKCGAKMPTAAPP